MVQSKLVCFEELLGDDWHKFSDFFYERLGFKSFLVLFGQLWVSDVFLIEGRKAVVSHKYDH